MLYHSALPNRHNIILGKYNIVYAFNCAKIIDRRFSYYHTRIGGDK